MTPQPQPQRIHDTIAKRTSRLTPLILLSLIRTHVLPLLVFVAALLVSGYVRLYVDVTFQDDALSGLTAVSTTLATLALTWWAWKWSEARFKGWSNVRRMFRVVGTMARLESALKAADQSASEAAARKAWEAYTALARALGAEI